MVNDMRTIEQIRAEARRAERDAADFLQRERYPDERDNTVDINARIEAAQADMADNVGEAISVLLHQKLQPIVARLDALEARFDALEVKRHRRK
jgi:hypothetical protein